jgi:hypothetical protein
MKKIVNKKGIFLLALLFAMITACDDKLSDINKNPNAIALEDGNVNLLMPSVLGPAASNYLNLGVNNMAGGMQHTQKSGWAGGHNTYDWLSQEWTGYYDILRTNKQMIENAREGGFVFHEAVGLTMRAFLFGQIADYWGDAPYSNALRGDEGGQEFQTPAFDSQESIYDGVLADLQEAATLFASGDDFGVSAGADLYFGGDMAAWERFANSLIIRYSVRISEKKESAVRSNVETIVSSGNFIKSFAEDATMDYTGGSNDQWPIQYDNEQSSTRYQACATLIDQLNTTNDPRRDVWFAPVQVQWVEDPSLAIPEDTMMFIDGTRSDIFPDWDDYRGRTETFTRLFNPNDVTYDTREFIGVPAGIIEPEVQNWNGNPNPGQGRHNIHVSMMTETFMDGKAESGDLLASRLLSAAEMHFTLAEMALVKGWSVGDAQTHYEEGIRNSLEVWGVGDQYDDFITQVPYDGTQEQILIQKWVASFTSATEAWNDYKRTGLPALSVGGGAAAPVPGIRFGYGGDEYNNNTDNINAALNSLETTQYSGAIGQDSQYSKQWLIQGTGQPY